MYYKCHPQHEISEMKKEMEGLERSNVYLREAVETWTDDKQMTGRFPAV